MIDKPEIVAWICQHEDTGTVDFVDTQQIEWGFEKNNPRIQVIAPLIRLSDHDAARAADKERIAELEAVNAINMPSLLDDLDCALEDLELFGMHSNQGYKRLKAWYKAVHQITNNLDAVLAQQGERC